MLNEFAEFNAYITDPESKNPRLQPKLFTEHFSDKHSYLVGIEQIMTVIARGFIFSKESQKNEEIITQQMLSNALELLHRWTGFSDTDQRSRTNNLILDQWITEHSFVDGWLKRYWMYQLSKAQSKLNDEEKDKQWKKLEKQWNESFNSPFDYYSYKITYKNVIANALETGPLKNRYLVVKKDESQLGKKVKEVDKKRFDYLFQFEQNTHADTKMKMIKLIAAYLIRQENHPKGQKEVWIKNSELANWYGLDDGKNGNITWYPQRLSWNGKPIYTRKTLKGSYSKVIVDPDYLTAYDFHVIKVADVAKYRETHWILEDCGHGLKDCWNIIK